MSKTKIQLMAGNSIVVSKLEAIFTSILKKIVSKKIKVKKDISKAVNNAEYLVHLSNVA